jgi:alpha-beta hydrolase superfamily lysophospholipase
LIHGLGDSPFSFVDLGPALAARGLLVRAILLPGCGTNPEDLIGVKLDDWRRTVAEHAALMATEVDRVYLGGFSTGANLALDHALADPSIAGLVLFAPAIVSNSSIAFLAPAAAAIMDWVVRPSPEPPSPVRYDMVPTDAFALWWRSSRRLARIAPYHGPALVILSESDSVVASEAVAEQFESRFPHPKSRLVWYGSPPKIQGERLLVRPDRHPALRIDNFSHMGILFSPSNPEYGPGGAQRLCDNGQDHDLHVRCLSEPLVRYSAWGAALTNEPTARLTFNPWFDWQTGVLDGVWGLEAPADSPFASSDPSRTH